MNKKIKNIIFLLIVLLTSTLGVNAQTIFSPYSNFGYGQVYKNNHPVIEGMGILGYGYRDHTVINYQNPASYTAIDTLSFIFDGGINFQSYTLSNSKLSEKGNYVNFNHFQMGFPIWKYIKATVGILPMSNVGYNIRQEVIDDLAGKQLHVFNGQGGINNFYGGLGFQIWNFSFGVNVSYLFGNIDKYQMLSYPDSAYYFNVKKLQNTKISSAGYNFGFQYYGLISESKKLYLTVGATYQPQIKLKSSDYLFNYTFLSTESGGEQIFDTVSFNNNEKAASILPQKIGFGIMIKQLNTFKIMANADWTQWSKFSSVTSDRPLVDGFNTSVGMEILPAGRSGLTGGGSYFRWVRYRAGAYYGQPGIVIDETIINQFGMTFGLCFPISRSLSSVNLGVDIGRLGTKSNDLVQESYIKATIGISIVDTWFYRIKYK